MRPALRRSGASAKLPLFVAAAVVSAAIFIRLGVWQLDRRQQRRARNALVSARLASPAVDATLLPRDTAAAHYRLATVRGIPDYDHELVYASRSRRGSPGVYLLTPVRVAGSDTAVLVNRGWVYSPDGAGVDLAKWHDRDSTFTGYVEEFPYSAGATFTGRPNVIARLSHDVVAKALPYPVAPMYVIALGDSVTAADRIARLTAPPLDEGPHLNYAIQWFFFALVALVGTVFAVRQSRSTAASVGIGPAGGAGGQSGDAGPG